MGNKIARTTQVSASEYYLHDLPSSYNLVLMDTLSRGRFLKSIYCKHDEGLVIVKVYFKRGDLLDLKEYERRLSEIREIFRGVQHSHLWPFQFWLETDKAAYLLRQFFFSNLHDRLSTRPFLSLIEKKWLAFQLLCAVKQSHENGVCHGDIKCENVLVTSWNWLYLTDFASFKPTYIPDDDPSDFSFFFDTGGRRRCYLAPERFYEHGGETHGSPDAPLKPSMDIFSLGCVIAELFLEGQPLFELSQLLAYRRGQYDPCQYLEKIVDIQIRKMILHMIQLDPESRLSCESYLQEFGSIVFPNYFSPFLHKFFSCIIPLDSDARVAVTQGAFQEIKKQLTENSANVEVASKCSMANLMGDICSDPMFLVEERSKGSLEKCESEKSMDFKQFKLANAISTLLEGAEESRNIHLKTRRSASRNAVGDLLHQDEHVEMDTHEVFFSLCREYKDKENYFLKKMQKGDLHLLTDGHANPSDAVLMSFFPGKHCTTYCEGMVLITSLLCSCIRSVKQPQLRRGAILLLMSSSLYIDDEDRLQHVIPYVVSMLADPAAIVRCAALETLCNILPLIQNFCPSDAKIFPEYILPMLSMLPDDPEESVRICYCSNIHKIALTAYHFLVLSDKVHETGTGDKLTVSPKSLTGNSEVLDKKQNGKMDTDLSRLRRTISDIVQELVMGSKQTPNIRRALLQDIGHLCFFFGEKQCNDFLLPILPAFLNDRDEQLRADFYGQIVFVCFVIGKRSVEEYLLPYIEQALNDDMEAVIVNALDCLTMLCGNGYLRKRILLDMIERTFSLLCYPILWVRRAAISFITACSESLGPVDSHVYLSPLLQPLLQRQPTSLTSEKDLISCLKPPVSKLVYYQVLQQARSSDMLERQRKIWYNSSDHSNQWETIEHSKKVDDGINLRDELLGSAQGGCSVHKFTIPDAQYIAKSRDMGSTARDISSSIDNSSLSSEKLQFSGFISPHVSDESNLLLDAPSEGIPVYSLSVDRRPGAATTNPDALFQWSSSGISSLSAPWMGPVSNSFKLSSSDPPKLFSGSIYNISNAPKQVTLSSRDSEGTESNQSSYITGKFHDISVSDALKGSSSIVMDDVSLQSEGNGLTTSARTSSVPDAGWRPRGVLVAHLQEHRSAVNDIAVSNDHSFFVSVSDDSSVKVWDTRKLEKDISFRSRLTYPLEGTRALCTTMLYDSAQVVVGACDGVIHIFSVDHISGGLGNVIERYSGIADVKKKEVGEGGIISLSNCSNGDGSVTPSVLFSTQSCGIHLWDTRMDSMSWKFKTAPNEGYVSSLVMGLCGNWFVSGTSRGVLTLWDMRFLLPVNSWKYATICPIEKMCLFVPPPNTTLSAMGRPLIYIAAGCNEVSLWNAENGSCHQVLRGVGCEGDAEMSSNIPWALASPSSKSSSKQDVRRNVNLKYSSDELNEPRPRLSGVRALLPLPGGDLLTGGTDLKIRYWDYSSPSRSFCICGPSVKGMGSDVSYDLKSSFGVQVVQEACKGPSSAKLTQKSLLAVAATDSAGCHHDSVLSMVSVKLNQRLLISSSRDGAIKVWK